MADAATALQDAIPAVMDSAVAEAQAVQQSGDAILKRLLEQRAMDELRWQRVEWRQDEQEQRQEEQERRQEQLERRQEEQEQRIKTVEARLDSVFLDTLKDLQGKLECVWGVVCKTVGGRCTPSELDDLRAAMLECLVNQ